MKKALILAYDFSPYNSVGAQRPNSWLRYFQKYGIYPVVVTRHWKGVKFGSTDSLKPTTEKNTETESTSLGTVIRVPHKPNWRDLLITKYPTRFVVIRKFLSLAYQILQFSSFLFDNKRNIYLAARKYLKENKVDVIIASGEPFILFRYASLLSNEFNIPWHADYRDDWTENHVRTEHSNLLQKILLKVESYYERTFLENVRSVSSVSQALTLQISKRLNIASSISIENGADLETIDDVEFDEYPKEFLIAYTGIMYDFPYMDDFIKGFELFFDKCEKKKLVKVVFVGIEAYVNQAVKSAFELRNKFPNNVEIIQHIPFREAVFLQKSASALLNLIGGDPSKGLIGAKCYVYAATRKPILSIPFVKSRVTPFFMNRDIHTIALSPKEVADFLFQRFNVFEKKESLQTSISDIERFELSREFQAQKLTDFLLKNYV